MAFNLSSWFLRRRIDAQARSSGRPIEHRRIGNPYHAVSIERGANACAAARATDNKRFLSYAAPMLPLRECTQSSACQCRYAHHADQHSSAAGTASGSGAGRAGYEKRRSRPRNSGQHL